MSELATQTAEQEKLSSQQTEAAERFGFFQRTRNTLSDLCGMLREKVRRVRYPSCPSADCDDEFLRLSG